MKTKIVVALEGPDNVGKSTLIERIAEELGAKILRQPSEENTVGFLRNIVKTSKEYTALENQLMHTVSHLADLLTEFDSEIVVMDRCFISTHVYSKVMNISDDNIQLLDMMNQIPYFKFFNDNNITFIPIVITNKEPFEVEDDAVYSDLSWESLRAEYVEFITKPEKLFVNTILSNKTVEVLGVENPKGTLDAVFQIVKIIRGSLHES